MPTNRSVPVDTVLPHITYTDVAEAIGWLSRAFGFSEHYRYGEPGGLVSGAQVYLGGVYFMLVRFKEGYRSPKQLGYGTQSLTIFVPDVDAHYARAKAAGAKMLEEPHETVYGEYQYAAEDYEGHHWLFSRHARDADPASWGAILAE
jgi:uncharacterized glyoxalase superfamily protein PhnB